MKAIGWVAHIAMIVALMSLAICQLNVINIEVYSGIKQVDYQAFASKHPLRWHVQGDLRRPNNYKFAMFVIVTCSSYHIKMPFLRLVMPAPVAKITEFSEQWVDFDDLQNGIADEADKDALRVAITDSVVWNCSVAWNCDNEAQLQIINNSVKEKHFRINELYWRGIVVNASIVMTCVLILILGARVWWAARISARIRDRRSKGLCIVCGYPCNGICPECGNSQKTAVLMRRIGAVDLPPFPGPPNYESQAARKGQAVFDERTEKRTTERRGIGRASGS